MLRTNININNNEDVVDIPLTMMMMMMMIMMMTSCDNTQRDETESDITGPNPPLELVDEIQWCNQSPC